LTKSANHSSLQEHQHKTKLSNRYLSWYLIDLYWHVYDRYLRMFVNIRCYVQLRVWSWLWLSLEFRHRCRKLIQVFGVLISKRHRFVPENTI